jgi:CBS domain-containing protein
MRVDELMVTELETVRADQSVADAIGLLADSHVSALPVLDGERRFVGVLSTSDVLQAEAECGSPGERERLFENGIVRDLMTSQPKTVGPDDDVREVAQQMLYLDVHRLFVVFDGELVGVISQSDIVRGVATARI